MSSRPDVASETVNSVTKVLEANKQIDAHDLDSVVAQVEERLRKEPTRGRLLVRVNGLEIEALPDSGNTFGNLISTELFRKLGGNLEDLKPFPRSRVGTANKCGSLDVRGELKRPLRFTVDNGKDKCTFEFPTCVSDRLSMPVNISLPFMVEEQWNQLHAEKMIEIKGIKFPLRIPYHRIPGGLGVYCLRKTKIDSGTLTDLVCYVHDPKLEKVPFGRLDFRSIRGTLEEPGRDDGLMVPSSESGSQMNELSFTYYNGGKATKIFDRGTRVANWTVEETEEGINALNVDVASRAEEFPMTKKQQKALFFQQYVERREKERREADLVKRNERRLEVGAASEGPATNPDKWTEAKKRD